MSIIIMVWWQEYDKNKKIFMLIKYLAVLIVDLIFKFNLYLFFNFNFLHKAYCIHLIIIFIMIE